MSCCALSNHKWGSGALLPLLVPWVLVPCVLYLLTRGLQSLADSSPVRGILLIGIPFGLWQAFAARYHASIFTPLFAPNMVAAGTASTIAVYVTCVHHEISLYLSLTFYTIAASVLALFWRMGMTDPGRIIMRPTRLSSGGSSRSLQASNATGSPCKIQIEHISWMEDTRDGESMITSPRPWSKEESSPLLDGNRQSGSSAKLARDACGEELSATSQEQLNTSRDATPTRQRRCITCNIERPPRSKHCGKCGYCIERFDHHCPAIKNCIGKKNHRLFILMLMGFVAGHSSFIICALQVPRPFLHLGGSVGAHESGGAEGEPAADLLSCLWRLLQHQPLLSTAIAFNCLQTLWQVPLCVFHLLCASANITTNEWVNWEKYPDLYVETAPRPGRPFVGKDFVNPYNKGVLLNLAEFLALRRDALVEPSQRRSSKGDLESS